jgi:hypothetical protein
MASEEMEKINFECSMLNFQLAKNLRIKVESENSKVKIKK